MKKLLIAFGILVAFIAGGFTNYYYNGITKKATTEKVVPVVQKGNTEIFKIDKTNFDTYSKTLLAAISKCVKEEKRLDVKSESDLRIFIECYHNDNFYTANNKMTSEQKDISGHIWVTSLNLDILLEAIQDNNLKSIEVQRKVLKDLLVSYNL
jgi:hypothetical protein